MPDLTAMIIFPLVLGVGITILTLGIIFFVFRRIGGMMNASNQLLATGEPAQAKILRMWDTGTTLNDNPMVGLALEVHPASRPAYQVETKALISRLKISQVQTGATVAVRFDPTDPSKVALVLP